MIYQIRTYHDIGYSKKYFTNYADVKKWLAHVVSKAEELRSKTHEKALKSRGIGLEVSKRELELSCEIIRINEEACPEWQTLFGAECELEFRIKYE